MSMPGFIMPKDRGDLVSSIWRNKHKNPGEYYRYQLRRKQEFADNLIRTGGKCQLGIEGVCTGKQEQAHHVLGVEAGLLSPTIPVCAACNRAIGRPSNGNDPAGGPLPW